MSEYNTLKYNKKITPTPRMDVCEINNKGFDIALSLADVQTFLQENQEIKEYIRIFPILIFSDTLSMSDSQIETLLSRSPQPLINPDRIRELERQPGEVYDFSEMSDVFQEYNFIYFPEISIDSTNRARTFLDPATNTTNQKIQLQNKLSVKDLSYINSKFCSLMLYTTFDKAQYFRDFGNTIYIDSDKYSYSFINLTKENTPVGQGVYDIRFEKVFPPPKNNSLPTPASQGYLFSLKNQTKKYNSLFASNISYSLSLDEKSLTSIFVIDKKSLCESNSNVSFIFNSLTEESKKECVDRFYIKELQIKNFKGDLVDSFFHKDKVLSNISASDDLKFYYFNDNILIDKNYNLTINFEDKTQSIFQQKLTNINNTIELIQNYFNKSNYFNLYSLLNKDINYQQQKETIISNIVDYYSLFLNRDSIIQITNLLNRLLDIEAQENNIEITLKFVLDLVKTIQLDLEGFLEDVGFSESATSESEQRAKTGSRTRRQSKGSPLSKVDNLIYKNINVKLFDLYLQNNNFAIDLLSTTSPLGSDAVSNSTLREVEGQAMSQRALLENQKFFNLEALSDLEGVSEQDDLFNTCLLAYSPSYIYDKSGEVTLNNTNSSSLLRWSPFDSAIKEIIILLDKFEFLSYKQSKKIINFYKNSGAGEVDGEQLGLLKIFVEYFISMLGIQTISQDPISQEASDSISSFNEENIINLVNSRFYLGTSEDISEEELLLSKIAVQTDSGDVSWNKNLFEGLTTNQYLIEFVHALAEKDDLSLLSVGGDSTLRSLNDYAYDKLGSTDTSLLPNQIKALFKNSAIINLTTFDWNRNNKDILFNFINYSIFKFNFDLVYNVEFLSGFEGNNIANESWSLLTRTNLQDYLDSGNTTKLLCRFKKNTKNTKSYKNLNFNILNKTFIINNPADLLQ